MNLYLLIVVTNSSSSRIATPLARACKEAGINWGMFFTNDGVKTLGDPELASTLTKANRAVVCQESWNQHMPDMANPVECGSQTDCSALVGTAARVLGL